MAGKKLDELISSLDRKKLDYFSVKESVFPFNKFDGVDLILGPEMKSTGEVMGLDKNFLSAFIKNCVFNFYKKFINKCDNIEIQKN